MKIYTYINQEIKSLKQEEYLLKSAMHNRNKGEGDRREAGEKYKVVQAVREAFENVLKLNPPERRNLIQLKIEHNKDADETQYPFLAYLEGVPGMIVQATTQDKAINELMTSIMVKLCHDAGIVPPHE